MPIKCLDINCNIAFQAVNRAKEFRAVQHTTVEPQSLPFGNI